MCFTQAVSINTQIKCIVTKYIGYYKWKRNNLKKSRKSITTFKKICFQLFSENYIILNNPERQR